MQAKPPPSRLLLRRYAAAAGLVYLLFCGAVITFVVQHTKQEFRATEEKVSNISLVIGAHIERVFQSIRWLCEAAGDAYLRNPGDPAALHEELKLLNLRENFSLQLSVLDKEGYFVASSVSPRSGADLRDREHVRVHLAPGGPDVFTSDPLVGRISKQKSINITRRLYDDKGSWVGIAVVSFDPDRLKTFFDGIDLGSLGAITLSKNNGALLAASGQLHARVGEKFQRTAPSVATASSLDQPSTYTGTVQSPIDHIERIESVRRISSSPLEISVGLWTGPIRNEQARLWSYVTLILGGLLLALMAGYRLTHMMLAHQSSATAAQMKVEEASRLNEMVQAAFRSSGVCVAIYDTNGAALYLNDTCNELLRDAGIPREAGISALIGTEGYTAPGGATAITRTVALGNGDRRIIHWSISCAPWLSHDARLAVGFDRTDIETRERALYQRSRLITLGEMSTGLAHEMAQPLTVISFSAAQLAAACKGSTTMAEPLDLLTRAATRLATCVERMKVFGRFGGVATGQFFEVTESVNSVLLLTQNALLLANIAVNVRGGSTPLFARGEALLFEQVLLNLMLNARDALLSQPQDPDKPREITIELSRMPVADGTMVSIKVSDTGPGIPDAVATRIFEPFFTTKTNGTGLGLALSFGIIEEMGGRLHLLKSTGGACFEVRLPEAEQPDDVAAEEAELVPSES